MLMGENGIITRAKNGAILYEDARTNEIVGLEELTNMIDSEGSHIDYTLPNKLLVSINPIIDKISNENNENDFTFNIYINDSNVPYKENINIFNEEMESGTKIRVVTNNVTGYTTSFDETTTIGNTNVTIKPKWTINKYDVNFVTNGGSEITKQIIEYGNKATTPEEPARENYRFLGWYSDEDLTNEFNFNTVIKGTTNIYAKWIATTDTPLIQIGINYAKNEGKTTLIYTDANGQEQTAEPTSDGGIVSVIAKKDTNFYLVSAYGSQTQWSINIDQFTSREIQIGTTEKIHFVVPDTNISFSITGKYSGQTRLRKIYSRSYDLSFIAD